MKLYRCPALSAWLSKEACQRNQERRVGKRNVTPQIKTSKSRRWEVESQLERLSCCIDCPGVVRLRKGRKVVQLQELAT